MKDFLRLSDLQKLQYKIIIIINDFHLVILLLVKDQEKVEKYKIGLNNY